MDVVLYAIGVGLELLEILEACGKFSIFRGNDLLL
jgi:hypothetical protein